MDFWEHLERDYSLRKSFISQFNESFFSLYLLNIFLWCPPVWLVSKKISHWMTGCRSSSNLVKTCGLIIQKLESFLCRTTEQLRIMKCSTQSHKHCWILLVILSTSVNHWKVSKYVFFTSAGKNLVISHSMITQILIPSRILL